MRKLICFLLLLLFVGTHGLPDSGTAFANLTFQDAQDAVADTNQDVSIVAGSGAIVTARQKCCDEDDALKTSHSNAPCSSDCSFTNAAFNPEFLFGGTIPSYEPATSLNAAFRHALFRPPIV
ncbi:hypothetical protein [Pararhizobium sp. IMCC21322]|uniref:hypothetical protein n=1 Tax=Pararhizobium sp. IMCC21322 TaxID=3067903 RepID=UPI00274123DA|nr:hypothetical protein [Pararhizobium sp. IMCC21322]